MFGTRRLLARYSVAAANLHPEKRTSRISEITFPRQKVRAIVSPNGVWKEIDTSFVDMGGVSDTIPNDILDHVVPPQPLALSPPKQAPSSPNALSGVANELRRLCHEFITMDRRGQHNTLVSFKEMNLGPDYVRRDMKLKYRRTWFSLRKHIQAYMPILFGSESSMRTVSLLQLYEVLIWVENAKEMGAIVKKAAYDPRPASDYDPLDLTQAIRAFIEHMEATSGEEESLWSPAGDDAVERIITISSWCRRLQRPFRILGKGVQNASTLLQFIHRLQEENHNVRPRHALLILSSLHSEDLAFSDPQSGTIFAHDLVSTLNFLCSCAVRDGMGSFTPDDIVQFLRFLTGVATRNHEYVVRDQADQYKRNQMSRLSHDGNDVSEKKSLHSLSKNSSLSSSSFHLRHFVNIASQRCRRVLYRRDENQGHVFSDYTDDVLPANSFLKVVPHHKQIVPHKEVFSRFVQGLQKINIGPESAANILRAMSELQAACSRSLPSKLKTETTDSDPLKGATLDDAARDLFSHAGHEALMGHVEENFKAIMRVANMVKSFVKRSPAGDVPQRAQSILQHLDQALPKFLFQAAQPSEIIDILEAYVTCGMLPLCLPQLEGSLLRMLPAITLNDAARILSSTAVLPSSATPHMLTAHLQNRLEKEWLVDRTADVGDILTVLEGLHAVAPGPFLSCLVTFVASLGCRPKLLKSAEATLRLANMAVDALSLVGVDKSTTPKEQRLQTRKLQNAIKIMVPVVCCAGRCDVMAACTAITCGAALAGAPGKRCLSALKVLMSSLQSFRDAQWSSLTLDHIVNLFRGLTTLQTLVKLRAPKGLVCRLAAAIQKSFEIAISALKSEETNKPAQQDFPSILMSAVEFLECVPSVSKRQNCSTAVAPTAKSAAAKYIATCLFRKSGRSEVGQESALHSAPFARRVSNALHRSGTASVASDTFSALAAEDS